MALKVNEAGVPDGGGDGQAKQEGPATASVEGARSSRRSPTWRGVATAGLAVALFGVAGAVVYAYLPGELNEFLRTRAEAELSAKRAAALTAPPKPVVVSDAPDPADIVTRVVVIEAGGDKNQAGLAPVVSLAKPVGTRDWNVEQETASLLIFRELVRQAFLIAARDELGLRTRDEVIDDLPPDASGRAIGELATTWRISGARLLFRTGEGGQSRTPWKEALTGSVDNSGFTPSLALRVEQCSRKEFAEVLRQAGLKGEPNTMKPDAPVPAEIEEKLRSLSTVDVFEAVRALHQLIRTDGESDARVAALARGYALLGALTSYQWSPAHAVFEARAMLYAQRVVARTHRAPWALRNRAFVHALSGRHNLALGDVSDAKDLDEKAKAPAPSEPWHETITAALDDDADRLAAVTGPYAKLAAFLRMTSLEHPTGTRISVHAARAVIKADPDCDRAYDVVCHNGDLGDLHETTVKAPVAFGESLPRKLKALVGLPAAVLEKYQGPTDEPKAVAALADVGKPGADSGEPSWGVLAHLARETRFVHVWRRLKFMAVQWSVPVDDFWTQAGPWVVDHRFLPFLETYVDPEEGYRLFARFVDDLDLGDLEMSEYDLYQAIKRINHPNAAYAWNVIIRHGGATAANYGAVMGLSKDHKEMYARVLSQINPHLRLGMAGLVETHWNDVKDRVPAWTAEAGESPTFLGALGKKYAELKRYKEAEDCLTRYIAKSADRWAYESLAGCYQVEGNEDRWKQTLDEYLNKTENAGLDHARVQVQLANWYMGKEQWDEAKDYAEAAAQTWAGWALLCAGRANEGLHDWERAEYWYDQAAERYPSTAWLPLFEFRQRTQHVRPQDEEPVAPEDQKTVLATLAGSAAMIQAGDSGYIHWLNGSTRKALDVFDAACTANPDRVDLAASLMLVADELGDVERRNSALDDLCTRLKDKAPKTCAVCALFRDSLADGGKNPLDLKAVDAILEAIVPQTRGNTEFVVGRFLLNRGRTDEAAPYLRRCADSPTGYTWTRSIASKTLRENEDQVE